MLRYLVCFVLMSWLTSYVSAQAPAPDAQTVVADLTEAKDAYRAAAVQAQNDLLEAFANEEKKIQKSKLKVDEKLDRAERLQAEKLAFETERTLPKFSSLQTAVRKYQLTLLKARTDCEEAFDAAAEQLGRIDLKMAKKVFNEKTTFFQQDIQTESTQSEANLVVGSEKSWDERLREIDDEQLTKDLKLSIEAAERLIETLGQGHVVVGQVRRSDDGSPEEVISQMKILPSGYFVEAVASPDAALAFWHSAHHAVTVAPKKRQGIEWLGEITLPQMTGHRTRLVGRALLRGTQIPSQLELTADYEPWPWNAIASSGDDMKRRQSELASNLKSSFPPVFSFDDTTGQFTISGLPTSRVRLSWGIRSATVQHLSVDVGSSDLIDLGDVILLDRIEESAGLATEVPSRASEGQADLDRLLEKFGDQRLSQNGQSFRDRVTKDLETLKQYRQQSSDTRAVLLIGQVSAKGQPANVVQAQSQIWPSGCFSFLVREHRLVGFRLHGYDPLNYQVRGSDGLIEYAGLVRMEPTTKSRQATVLGRFVGPPQVLRNITVRLSDQVEGINWYNGTGGYHGARGRSFAVPVRADGSFESPDLSPISYHMTVSAPGHVDEYYRSIRLQAGEKQTLVPVALLPQRSVRIEYLVSSDGTFVEGQSRSTTLKLWESLQAIPPPDGSKYPWDGRLIAFGPSTVWEMSYQPTQMIRLGSGDLQTYRNVSARVVHPQFHGTSVLVREGDVYLLNCQHAQPHHWVLLKVHSIRELDGSIPKSLFP